MESDPLAELAEVRRAYSARLPARLAELTAAIDDARMDAALVPHAHMLAHRLGGSAGSYGHPAVGAAVEEIERALHDALVHPARRDELLGDALLEPLQRAQAGVVAIVAR